jgi:RimJ/RimL family protein N-acetyltransferase
MSKSLFMSELVRLAAPQPDDDEIFAEWSENDEYLRLMDTDPAMPMNAAQFAKREKELDSPNSFLFRLRTVATDRLIGFVALEISWANRNAFLAIGIGDPEYWGKGYGSDALQLILRYAFDELSLYRVGLNVISNNERAIHTYEKAGFIREGAQREYCHRDGQRFDLVYFGILEPEWRQWQEQHKEEAPEQTETPGDEAT